MQDIKKNIEDIYELTPMQQGMLFHTLYTEGSDAYFEQFCYKLEGQLDINLFERAWKEIVSRHAVLRTSLQWKGISKPVQIVNKSVDLFWTNLDWSNKSEDDKISNFKEFIRSDRKEGFNVEKAPLMRCTLIKLRENLFQFVWSFHHIIMDGWSYPVIQKEVFTIYKSLKDKTPLNLPEPISYKQFIVWLNKQDTKSAEKFWKEELRGIDSPTPIKDLNVLRSSKHELKDEVAEASIKLDEKLAGDLQELTRKNQLTLNTIIQGAWAIILSTYRNEDDVMFGATVSGRTPLLSGVGSMVGLFINTLPVRVRVNHEEEVVSWLKKLQSKHIDRDQYSYSSLVDIQQSSDIPRGSQLFENILVFENYPIDKSLEEGAAGIKIKELKAFERTSFPFTILIAPGKILEIKIAYETSNFSSKFVEQVLCNFKNVLETISTNPSQRISELSLLSDEEKNKVLFEWNNTEHYFPSDKCIHQLIEEQAKKVPDNVAVEFHGKTLSYKELNEQSNQIANYLLKLGAGPDVIVGICIERSFEMLTGLLGILKSGSAYVPLDSAYPQDRLTFMIEDSGAAILLTTKNILERIPKTNAKFILLDEDEAEIQKQSKINFQTNLKPENLAYIIYTSGSTGTPKGVLMKHEALVNLLYWQLEGQSFEKELRTLQFTTLSFDVSFQEIFSTWYSGGTLVLMNEDERRDLTKVLDIIREKKIQRLFLPFIALNELSEIFLSSKSKTLYLKEVMTAGEQVQSTQAVTNFFDHINNFNYTNQYGPSEAHVVTSYTLQNNTSEWAKLPPIGRPIYNTQIYILNKSLKPVPIGVSGDLYIGGKCLVRGYHNRKELTEETFIDNPVDKNLSSKIYKTGDNARYLDDGNIEYLGRSDTQVKIRGIRVELGEIESILSQDKDVKNVVVVSKEFNGSAKRLVAYIVPTGKSLDISEIKNFLKTRLPDYLIPSDFVFLKEMPLTPSGKVDQKSLPAPELMRTTESSKYAEPKDTLELQLVRIWEKVLGIKPIGINDNFFELGGHSLLALRVFGYIEKLTGRKLSLSTLFTSPTISELATILKNEGWTPPWKSLVAVKPGGSKLPFYCVPPGAGTALHFQGLVKYIPDDQPFYVLESVGLDGKEPPHDKIETMAAFYVKEIQTLQPEGPYLLGGRCFGGRVVFEMAQQFEKLGQKVALLAIFDTWPPFTAAPPTHIPQRRDLKHFITRTFHHLKSGELWKVAKRYSLNKFLKTKWKVMNKLEYIFTTPTKRLYKQIMLLHFNAQDRYIAKKYQGKVTLIECSTFKPEYREGWQKLAGGGFETYTVPDTNHKTIVREPKLKYFAEKLNFVLEKTHDEINQKHNSNGSTDLLQKKIVHENIPS